jgi:uncharacterized membrane protein (UPF0136 family)
MTEEAGPVTFSMPRQLKFVRGFLWFQGLANAFIALLVLSEAANDIEHGRDEGLAVAVGVVSLLIGLLLVACAIRMSSSAPWVRATISVLEVLIVLNCLVGLILGGPITQVVGLIAAILVLTTVNGQSAREWFAY